MMSGRIQNPSRRRTLEVHWAESGVVWEAPIGRRLWAGHGRRGRRLAGRWLAGRLHCGDHALWVSVPEQPHSRWTRGPGRIDLNWL
jgi:hypothetical protein